MTRISDYILDKLYKLESDKLKDDICFLVLVTVAGYFSWQVLRAVIG